MKYFVLILAFMLFTCSEALAGRWCSVIASSAAIEKQRRRPVATVLKKVAAPIQKMRAPIPDAKEKCTGPECQTQQIVPFRRILRR